jgi:hypothetical protein
MRKYGLVIQTTTGPSLWGGSGAAMRENYGSVMQGLPEEY